MGNFIMRLKIKRYNSCVGQPVGIGWKINRITESSECYYLNLYQPLGLLQGEGFVARVPAARLELVDGGHMLPVTQPERCAAFIRRAAGIA